MIIIGDQEIFVYEFQQPGQFVLISQTTMIGTFTSIKPYIFQQHLVLHIMVSNTYQIFLAQNYRNIDTQGRKFKTNQWLFTNYYYNGSKIVINKIDNLKSISQELKRQFDFWIDLMQKKQKLLHYTKNIQISNSMFFVKDENLRYYIKSLKSNRIIRKFNFLQIKCSVLSTDNQYFVMMPEGEEMEIYSIQWGRLIQYHKSEDLRPYFVVGAEFLECKKLIFWDILYRFYQLEFRAN